MTGFIEGALTLGYLISALFFLRFWASTRDRLFLIFSCAFGLMAVNRLVLSLFAITHEHVHFVYLLRLLSFLLILFAIIDKNRKRV
jgi:hypothetical protein